MSAHSPIPPSRPRQQPATFADAEVRGKLRQWKERLARQYRVFESAYNNRATLQPVIEDMVKRSSDKGRHRAFDKLAHALGPGVTLEGLRLDGKWPLAVWSILKPREAVTVDATPESGKAQDCVCVSDCRCSAASSRVLCETQTDRVKTRPSV